MLNLLSIDGPIYKCSIWIYRVMALTFFWLLLNIPILTIGPSTIAMFSVAGKLVRKEEINIPKMFWIQFKKNIKQGLVLTVISYVLGVNIILSIQAILLNNTSNWIFNVLTCVLIFEIVGLLLYTFPLISRYEMSILQTLKYAFLMSNFHLFTTITGCIMILIMVYIYFQSPLFFMMIGPGSFVCVWYFMIKSILNRYESNE